MAPGSKAPASFHRRYRTTAALLLIVCVTLTESAPTTYDEIESKQTDLAAYLNDPNGCYYNYQHYEEGDRIVTNEPCLNCTCHNRMLMCYLRVCPFTKAIGQDCTVQKLPDQCCPTISCPEVPVHLLASSTTPKPITTTEIGWHDNYGCIMNEDGFFPDGAQVPPDPKKPCELCYCIRNRTACVMQECTLHVEGCRPVYEDGVCCPVRYDCDYENEKSTTSTPQSSGGLVFSTTSAPFDCRVNDDVYRDGESIAMVSNKPCEHCYCMRGDIVCAVQDCGEPLRGKDCTPETPPSGQCCPTSYQCANETISSGDITTIQPASLSDSDQNEAEKYPLNENAYDKLGEHQPNQQDDINNEDSDNVYTTQANMNDITDSGQIINTNENVHNNVSNNNNNVLGESNTLPVSDDLNISGSDKNIETSSTKPESLEQVNPTGTESDQVNNENPSSPVESTKLPASDPLLNENVVNLTNQTSSVEDDKIKIIEENKDNESPIKNSSQNDLTPNIPNITTENSLESETQSFNHQDKPQEIIPEQTESPAIIEKDPIKSNNDERVPEQQSDDKSPIETTSDEKQNNEESTETYTGDNKYPTVSLQNQDFEQATQKISQDITEKTPLKETIVQTNVELDSPNQSNLDSTQISQTNYFNTESPSNVEQNIPNNNEPQEENTSPPEIPKVDTGSIQQGNMPEETKPLTGNLPELEKTPAEQNPDKLHEENALLTEVPKLENETTEQNKLPLENKPEIESQTESEKITFNDNQESAQGENVSPTEIPNVKNQNSQQEENVSQNGISNVENKPTEQNKPIEGNESSTDNPKEENIHGQNIPLGDTNLHTENISEPQKTPTEQNQDSPQFENESSTQIPKVENEPVEQNKPITEKNSLTENQPESEKISTEVINQETPQSESKLPTEIPKVQNEPTEQNTPLVENSYLPENDPQTNKTPNDQNNQANPQSENVLPTNIPEVENEPIEPNKHQEESHPLVENQPESQTTPTEKNQDDLQIENASSTEFPKIENGPIEQNTALEINNQQTEKQPESLAFPTEQNKLQTEDGSSTEISNIENEPIIQNTPLIESNSQTENQPENQKNPADQSQGTPHAENTHYTDSPIIESSSVEQNKPTVDSSSQSENQPQTQNHDLHVPLTENPSKLNEPQTDNVGSLPANNPTIPVLSLVPEKDLPAEQPVEDNNIFIVSPTSPPLFSQNQIKSEEPASVSNINDNKDSISSTEKNEIENQQPSSDDKPASAVNTNINYVPISSTELAPEINNASPQASDENIEHSTETKPIEKVINNDVTSKPENVHETTPISDEHNDNRFGSNNPVSSEPELIPTTENNKDVNSAIVQHVQVDDSSQENQPENEDPISPNSESMEHQNALQTDSPVEIEVSTNKYPSSADNQENDVTTAIPQQQTADNNIPEQPVQSLIKDPSEPIKTQEETKIPINLIENGTPDNQSNNNDISEMSGIQHSDETSKLTESPIIDTNYVEQSMTTQNPEQNENDSVTLLVQTQDKPVNEIEGQKPVYPDSSLSDNNNMNTATGLSQNNEENVTPLTDKIDTNTKAQDSSDSSIKDLHKDNIPESITISSIKNVNQDNLGNLETVNNEKNVDTTNSYDENPSVLPFTNSPAVQADNNETNSPENASSNGETNVNDLQTNTVPQQSVNLDETSTQYNIVDSSTNNPIQETPIVNGNNNVEENTNVLTNSEIISQDNQDSNTESEILVTQTPIENNILSVDSNKTPTNDVTMEIVSNLSEHTNVSGVNSNEVVNEKPSENPKKPDYVIDITTTSYIDSPNTPESIQIEDQVNHGVEVTTSNAEKYNDETTELFESIQSGVPGEGSCLIDFVTYAHKAEIPKSNPCHEKCECLNSIVTCTSVNCPPAPPQHRNCIPLHPGNESWCCPTYMCDGGIEGQLFESHNPISPPQLISTIVLEDKPSEENDQNTPVDEEIPSTPIPQIAINYNTLAPDQIDTNSDTNLQNNNGIPEIPAQTENPMNKIGDSVGTSGVNDLPVTIANSETAENEKPNESDQLSENEKLGESDQSSNDEKPVENENPEENSKPTESDQPAENEKPIGDSETDVTTVSYVNIQTNTKKPEPSNNMEEQSTFMNTVHELQGYQVPSTDLPNYETTITNILQTNDQNQPQQNSESDNSPAITTVKYVVSNVDQQVDDHKTEGVDRPNVNEEFDAKPVVDVTDLPASNVSPIEGTQTPTILADEKPSTIENNTNGLRPSSVDDIISSVNMVKEAVKNSLESSSKPTEIYYQTTSVAVDNYQPTVLPEESASSSSENAFPDKISELQTTMSSINVISELTTDVIVEKLPEISAPIEITNDSGVTSIPNITPSVNSDQGVSTNLPLSVSDKQEIPAILSSTNDDIIANQPAETFDNKTSEVTTTQNLHNTVGQDVTNNGPSTASDSVLPQSNVELNTYLPETTINNKISDTTTPSSGASESILTDDAANRPVEEEKPETENPILLSSDVNANKIPVEISTQAAVTQSSFDPADTGISNNDDKRFGVPSSSPTPSEPATQEDDNKRPQESGDKIPTPLDTEDPSSTPSVNTPFTPHKQPTYTSIPQSTWTQKPFHHDSTSEAPAQPDQGFPEDYDEENEAVYGPGTCRYGGKVYVSAQQVPRDDPCDFCFCFRGDIICLQQSCPPPIFGCYQENIQGFCCPRYECPVAQATLVNTTSTTTTTTTVVPPHFFANAYRGAARRTGCLIHGHAYRVGEDVGIASGPCLECICGADGKMKCDPKSCGPEPLIRKMMAEAVDQKRR